MIYWSLQQTAKFNNKACLILHLIAAASNIYLEQQEGSRESQYKVHIIGFFFLSSVHADTLKVFFVLFFPCLLDFDFYYQICYTLYKKNVSRGSPWCLHVTILNIIYPQTGQLSLIHINLKKRESNFVFWIHFFFFINLFFTCSLTTGGCRWICLTQPGVF